MKTIFILAPWSAGSTSVAGFLDKSGGYSCPPHRQTNDARTPDAYEPAEYREALLEVVDEQRIERAEDAGPFTAFLRAWLPVQVERAKAAGAVALVLKHPLQSLLLPELDRLSDPTYVVVSRPFDRIEATRLRRGWAEVYGQKGAERIYNVTYAFLHGANKDYFTVPFEVFRGSAAVQERLLQFCHLSPTGAQRADAQAWLK